MENLRFYRRILHYNDENFKKDLKSVVELSIKNADLYKKKINLEKNQILNETRLDLNYSADAANVEVNNLTKKISKTSKKISSNQTDIKNEENIYLNDRLINLNESTRFFYIVSKMSFDSISMKFLLKLIKDKNHQHKTLQILKDLLKNSEQNSNTPKIVVPVDYKSNNKNYIKDSKLVDGAALIIGHQKMTMTSENYFNSLKNFVKNYVKMRYLNE